jgi:Malate/L-lactate dehydrogenase
MSESPSARGETAAVTVSADALRRFTREVFVRAGMPEPAAATVADALVWADLRGVDSHGVSRITMYLRLIDDGDLNVTPAITTRSETAASVLLDADRAAGPVAMTMAMRAAVGKAREAGVGLALVRATTHTAALAYYTLMAAEEDMAGRSPRRARSWPITARAPPASRRIRCRSPYRAARAGRLFSTWRRGWWPAGVWSRRGRSAGRFRRAGRSTVTVIRRPILRRR